MIGLSRHLFLFASTAMAIPLSSRQDGGGIGHLTPPNTTINYFQGSYTGNTCFVPVGSAVWQQGVCSNIKVSGISITQHPRHNCTLTMYPGSTTCDSTAGGNVYQVPAGNASTCVFTDVFDGGENDKASAVWSCS